MNNREKILKFVKNEIIAKGIPPTIREIRDEVGLKSTSSVQYHLNILEEDGLIQRDRSKSRSIKFENFENNSMPIPIVGEIAAGHPLLAEEYNTGTLHIPKKYETKNEIFALKISGLSRKKLPKLSYVVEYMLLLLGIIMFASLISLTTDAILSSTLI